MNYKQEAVKELVEMDKICEIDDFVFCAANENIIALAAESTHMKIGEFVSMCLEMANSGVNLGAC